MRYTNRSSILGAALLAGTLLAVLVPALSQASPSGRNGKIAYSVGLKVGAIDPSGGPESTLVGQCSSPGCDAIGELAWSHHGRRLAFVRGYIPGGSSNPPKVALFVVNASGGHLRRLLACGSCGVGQGSSLSWSPDDSRIVVSDRHRLALVNVKTSSHRLVGPTCATLSDTNPAWSPDGSRIAFGCGNSLYVATRTGRHAHVIATLPSYIVDHPSWSPNGGTIAFDDPSSLYSVSVDGSHLTTLLAGQPGNGPLLPAWSHDGTRILYVFTPGVPEHYFVEVWVMKANGTNNHRLFSSGWPLAGGYTGASWSPDGASIAFSLDTTAESGLMLMHADGTGLQRIAPPVDQLAWQPLP